jgi:hypothetical protein
LKERSVAPLWILYAIDEYGEKAVAEFDHDYWAQDYVEGVTLEIFPNGSRRFRKDSLLSGYNYYKIQAREIKIIPLNPIRPTSRPQKEYIVIIEDQDRSFRVNHGKYKNAAEKDIENINKRGGKARLEEKYV